MPHAEDALEKITRSHARASTLRGRAFFVAWNGVLTMAYEGWTEGVARYKRALNDPEVGLQEVKVTLLHSWGLSERQG